MELFSVFQRELAPTRVNQNTLGTAELSIAYINQGKCTHSVMIENHDALGLSEE